MAATAPTTPTTPTTPTALTQILCGPVLRTVALDSVTVFLAFTKPKHVTLRVYKGETGTGAGIDPIQTGSGDTVRLGDRLHVLAVTTNSTPATQLVPGTTYGYQVFFADSGTGDLDETGPNLFTPGMLVPNTGNASGDRAAAQALIGFPAAGRYLPSFQVAPQEADKLRLLYGADRMPDGEGPDALAYAEQLIRAALAPGGPARPHLLLLAGGQLRADDLSDTMLAVTRRALTDLGVRDDPLPAAAGPVKPGDLGPGGRRSFTEAAGFPIPRPNQLLSFAEYAVAHLLCLADSAWPDALPDLEAVHPGCGWKDIPDTTKAKIAAHKPYDVTQAQGPAVLLYRVWAKEAARLTAFRQSLGAVRRAMANVPVLSVLGQHEITGHWNHSRAGLRKLLGNPVGRRVVSNGMAAHAVFQAWGNVPVQFRKSTDTGTVFLGKLRDWLADPAATTGAAAAEAISKLTGVPSTTLVRPAGALTYHHALIRPGWQVLSLDTQTDRVYPTAEADSPQLVSDTSLNTLWSALPATTERTALTVVTSTPLLLTPPHRALTITGSTIPLETAPELNRWLCRLIRGGVQITPPVTPPDTPRPVLRRRMTVISGGTGHGFVARLRYSADLPYDGSTTEPSGTTATEAVIAYLSAAPLCNVTESGLKLHHDGYVPGQPVPPTADYVGWNVDPAKIPAGVTETAGKPPPNPLVLGVTYSGSDAAPTVWSLPGRPQIAERTAIHRLDRRPQWRWCKEFLAVEPGARGEAPLRGTTAVSYPDQDAGQAWDRSVYTAAARNQNAHRDLGSDGSSIVGQNALGEVTTTFATATAPLTSIRAVLWWAAPADPLPLPLSPFTVLTDPIVSCYDDQLYAGRSLRRGDQDVSSGKAIYEGLRQPSGKLVANLRADLKTLGFLVVGGDPPGVFGKFTGWAVREFQQYARSEWIAQEISYPDGVTPPARWVDRLQEVQVPEKLRYPRTARISGALNEPTRRLIAEWLRRRWRCPVVVEAFDRDTGESLAGNIWRNSEPGSYAPQVCVTDFTRRYPVTVPSGVTDPTMAQPAPTGPRPDAPALPRLRPSGRWADYPAPSQRTATTLVNQGPQVSLNNGVWSSLTEILPERVLNGSPSFATLVQNAHATPPPADAIAILSTFKVLRAVTEVESTGYFDGTNAYDGAFMSVGPVQWTAGMMNRPENNVETRPNDGWAVDAGELWALMCLLDSRDPAAFQTYFGSYGLTTEGSWGRVWDSQQGKYVSRPKLETETSSRSLATVGDYEFLRSWHSMYRFLMASRNSESFQRAMWALTAQRFADLLNWKWPWKDHPAYGVADVQADRPDRSARLRDIFTSEMCSAILLRWHVISPGTMIWAGAPAYTLRQALEYARTATCPQSACTVPKVAPWTAPKPDFTKPPDTWTDRHENALRIGLEHYSQHQKQGTQELRDSMAKLMRWPKPLIGSYPFQLPIDLLPAGSGPDDPANERRLRTERNTMSLHFGETPLNGPHPLTGGTP